MRTLLTYEFIKILKRKSSLIALAGAVVLIMALVAYLIQDNVRMDEKGNNVYGRESILLKKEQLASHEGPLTTDQLKDILQEYQDYIGNKENYGYQNGSYSITNEAYGTYEQKNHELLSFIVGNYSSLQTWDPEILSTLTSEELDRFYLNRTETIHEILNAEYPTGNYSEEEKAYFLNTNHQLETPFYFSDISVWDTLIKRGMQVVVLLLSFVICISVAPVFAGEYQTGADAILLSSRFGRSKLIRAKLLSSLLYATAVYILGGSLLTAPMLCVYGTVGWHSPIQLSSFTAAYPLTMFQLYLFGIGIGYLVAISSMALTLLFSAIAKTAFSTMILSTIWIFSGLFVPFTSTSRAVNRLIAFLPANIANTHVVFSAYDTYTICNIFGRIFPYFFIGALFYLLMILVCMVFANHIFKTSQVRS